MIRKIAIENFMSLRNVKIDLEPLTVFVGTNASGKSAVFKALVTLSKLLGGTPLREKEGDFNLEDGVTLDDLVWRGNSGFPIKFRVWLDDDADDDNPTSIMSPEFGLRYRANNCGPHDYRLLYTL